VVRLDVSVFDRVGRPVKDLASTEFTVFEQGAVQQIVVFQPVRIAGGSSGESAWSHEAIPDTTANVPVEGRLWVLILDDATVGVDPWVHRSVKQIANRVIDQMDPSDRMAVVFPRNNRNAVDFTNVRARLRTAVEAFDVGFMQMGTFPSASGAASSGVFRQLSEISKGTDHYATSSSIKTLRATADLLGSLPEHRRVLVYVGVGASVDATANVTSGSVWTHDYALSHLHETKLLLERAAQAGVSVYLFDACGLVPASARVALCAASIGSVDFMHAVATETGGRATLNTNDFEPGIRRMFVENESYYLIGYQTSTPQSVAYRRIEVKVNRPGVEVRAREGYWLESERERVRAEQSRARLRPAAGALAGILPQTDLPLRLVAVPFAQRGRQEANVVLAVGAELSGLVVPTPGGARETLAVETRAFTPEGQARGEWRRSVEVTVLPVAASAVPIAEVIERVQLRPGRYSLRVGAHGRTVDTAGSVYADVEVPDFASAPLSVSGIAIGIEPRAAHAGERSVSGWLPIIPTSERTFTAQHEVTSFLQVYQGGRTPLEAITLRRRVLDRDSVAVLDESEDLPPARFGSTRTADVLWTVPTTALRPGPYLLRITASHGSTRVERDIVFRRQ
jgi:VWFA-related protein